MTIEDEILETISLLNLADDKKLDDKIYDLLNKMKEQNEHIRSKG